MAKREWIPIDRLGTLGIEPDMMPVHRDPQSLDEAVNVRALGANLANAGGYRLVANGSLPQTTIPSSCLCPTIHYERTTVDGDVFIDQSWNRVWPWTASRQDHWIAAFEVNAAAQDYDQTLIIQEGECEASRQKSIQLQIINTAPTRKVRLIETDSAGAESVVHLDHDASAVFGDGQVHWVFVERHSTTNAFDFRIVLDTTSLYDSGFAFAGGTDYLTFRRANSQIGTGLPVVMWDYSAAVWACLTGGGYTGLGSCAQTGPQMPIRIDIPKSSAALNFYRGGVVAVPQTGAPAARNAWSTAKPVTGPVYFEIPYEQPNCRGANYAGGAAGSGIVLGNSPPGTVAGSVGVNQAGDCYVDNAIVQANAFETVGWSWLCIAYDPTTNQVWFGDAKADGTREWAGAKVPGTDAGYSAVITDIKPVLHMVEATEAMRVVSGSGCRFALPSGFSYLEPS